MTLRTALLGLLTLFSHTLFAAPPTGNYKILVERLNQLQSAYPKYAQVFSIGTNDQGTELYGLRISINPTETDHSKIGHLVVGTHHGNETHAPIFTMNFAEMLLQKYASAQLLRGRLVDTEWSIIPVLNVPGYNSSQRWENGSDSNRDYPSPCTTKPGGKLASIRAVMAFMATRIFTGSVTVHGYVGSLTYPWGIDVTDTHTLDHNLYEKITRNAAALNGYQYGTSTDIVYPADGTFEDYVYWKHGMWSLLLELRNGSPSDLEKTKDAIWHFFDNLDSSPSTQHYLASSCARVKRPDLHLE